MSLHFYSLGWNQSSTNKSDICSPIGAGFKIIYAFEYDSMTLTNDGFAHFFFLVTDFPYEFNTILMVYCFKMLINRLSSYGNALF